MTTPPNGSATKSLRMMKNMPKLPDETVRKILAAQTIELEDTAKRNAADGKQHWSEPQATAEEIASLAQEVLDLRTANGLLESAIETMKTDYAAAGLTKRCSRCFGSGLLVGPAVDGYHYPISCGSCRGTGEG
jgi:hypothetical protein